MFVTPLISVYPPDFDRKHKLSSASWRDAALRLSTGSSDASSLHCTSSTTSKDSASRWSTSPVSSDETHVKTTHRKKTSRVSFTLPRPLQPFHKRVQSQPQIQSQNLELRYQPEPQSQPVRPTQPTKATQRRSGPVPPLPDSADWKCSDLVVRCKTDVYHVDRTIMSYHSRWFAKVCAIMTTPRTSKSVIDLSADDPDAVAAMMQYCYQLDYAEKTFDSDCAVDELGDLRPHVNICMLAKRYGMAGLKRAALEKFQNLATTMLMFSGNEEEFLEAVRTIYAPSRRVNAEELRQAAIKICADHVQGFISGSQSNMAMVFESMDTLPEFRTDLFEEMAYRWR